MPRQRARPVVLVTILLAVTFGTLAALAGAHRVNDPDVFWLARAGRDLLANGAAPTRNLYAYTDTISPWVLHETLFAIAFFTGFRILGFGFPSLAGLAFAGLTFGITLHMTLRRSRSLGRGTFGGLLLLLVAPALFEPRPAYASVLFAVLMVRLAFWPGWSMRRAALSVGLELVWANAHGSFPLGLVLLLASAVGQSRSDRALRIVTLAAATLATLMNPYGTGLYALIARYLFGIDETARLIHAHVVEFFPLWNAAHTPFLHPGQVLALILTFLLAGRTLIRRERVAGGVVVLAVVGMTLYQARHLALAVVLGVLLVLPDVASLEDVRLARARRRRALRITLATLAPGLLVGVASWVHATWTRGADDWIAASLGGAPFARLARTLPDGAKVYAPFQPSGMLLWLGRDRRIQVFFDPRNDCYSARVARMAFALEADDVAAATVRDSLAWGGTEYAVVPTAGALGRALQGSPSWMVKEVDDGWALLAAVPLLRPRAYITL